MQQVRLGQIVSVAAYVISRNTFSKPEITEPINILFRLTSKIVFLFNRINKIHPTASNALAATMFP